VFAFWWAFKPRWSRTQITGDRTVRGDPLLGRSKTAQSPQDCRPRSTASPAAGHHPSDFRPDIEGLRAIAVLLVLGYHIGVVRNSRTAADAVNPWFFDGGLVGVDVFFVLSGFLITSLLLRELTRTGTISLARFWSRRVRRLLAASCLVIVVTLIASRWMLDPLRQKDLAKDSVAASFFVVNIVFGSRGSDYLARDLAPSPLLHFWSLALEEQFYLVWPGLLLLVSRGRNMLRSATATIAVLGIASFIACLWFTDRSPVWAFYLLPTRAWELLVGAGLAVVGTRVLRVSAPVRATVAWGGLAAIIVSVFVIDERTRFPGYAALLPVLGTAALVGAGHLGAPWSPTQVLSIRPMQWIGKHSYAIYLWHWPALILVDAKYGPLDIWQLTIVVAFSVGLAALSYHYVEDPVRRSKSLGAPARRGLVLGAVLIATGAGAAALALAFPPSLSGGGTATAPTLPVPTNATTSATIGETIPGETTPGGTSPTGTDPSTSDATVASSAPAPIGSLDDLESSAAPALEEAALATLVPDNLRPSLGKARGDLPGIYDDGCLLPESGRITADECVYGDPDSDVTVVLAGDSHAAQWFPAVEEAASRRGWRLVVLTKRGCPAATFPTYGAGNRERTECTPWRAKVAERLTTEQPDLLIVASYRYRLTSTTAPADSDEVWQAALDETLGAWRPLTSKMLVLSDTPNPIDDIPSCLSGHLRSATDCVRARDEADRSSLVAAERQAAAANDAAFATTSNWLCGDATCPVILGDLLLYRDDNHITATASVYLTPFIEAAAAPLLS